MATTENARHRLYQRLETLIGSDEADTLMELLPPVGWAQVATKDDLAHLDRKLTGEIRSLEHRLHAEMAEFRGEVHGEFALLRSEMATEIALLRSEMATEIAGVRTDMAQMSADFHRTMRTNAFLTIGATSAIVTSMTALMALA